MSIKDHQIISRDIRQSAEAARSKFLQEVEMLERESNLWRGIRNGLLITISAVGVFLTAIYFNQ